MLAVYGFYVPVLLAIALAAMAIKNRLDSALLSSRSTGRRRSKRGSGSDCYVLFAGSIAASVLFPVLTAVTHLLTAPVVGMAVSFSVKMVLVAAGLNIATGLAAL